MIEVFLGSGLGGVFRYSLGLISLKLFNLSWPGTLFVNVIGSVLIVIIFKKIHQYDQRFINFFVTGFLGGFTTFSSFSLDIFKSVSDGNYQMAIMILFLNITLGIIMGVIIFR